MAYKDGSATVFGKNVNEDIYAGVISNEKTWNDDADIFGGIRADRMRCL